MAEIISINSEGIALVGGLEHIVHLKTKKERTKEAVGDAAMMLWEYYMNQGIIDDPEDLDEDPQNNLHWEIVNRTEARVYWNKDKENQVYKILYEEKKNVPKVQIKPLNDDAESVLWTIYR